MNIIQQILTSLTAIVMTLSAQVGNLSQSVNPQTQLAQVAQTPITVKISATADDGDEWNNSWNSGGGASAGYNMFGSLFGIQSNIGLRFNGVTVSGTINSAHITVKETGCYDDAGTVMGTIYAWDVANAPQFGGSNRPSTVPKTTASANWSFDNVANCGGVFNTPDLSSIIQELVDSYGLSNGSINFAIISSATNNTNALLEDFSHVGTGEATLTISYTPSGGTPPPPTLTTPSISSFSSSPSSIQSGQSSTLSWSVTGNPTPTLSINQSIGTVTGTTRSVSPTQTTTYTLTATNSQGSTNANTTVTVTATPPPPTPDTTPPSIPTGLSATAVSSSQINLSWNSSTDNIGVTGYDIYRNGSPLTSTSNTNYNNTGLSASTQYSYTVRSKDAAGNVSSQSSSVSATTQAATPPPPSGSLTCTVTTANLSQSTVQTAINNAADGAVVCVPAGSATWNGMAFSNSKGVTLAGASAWGGGVTTINPSSGGIGLNGTCSGTNTKLYRITGFTFNGGTNVVWHNAYNTGGCTMTNVRIDNNIFSNQAADSRILMFGDNSNNSYYYGVIDHNIVTNSSNVLLAEFYASNGSNAPAGPRGSANNMFFEDNTITIASMTNAGAGCIDSTGTPSIVWRRNTTTNCLLTSHGTTGGGGITNFEIYSNNFIVNTGANGAGFGDCGRCFHHQGAGETLLFNNIFTQASGQSHAGSPMGMTHYRSAPPSVAGYSGSRCDGTAAGDGNRPGQMGYPCKRQPGRDVNLSLQPMYIWQNRWSDNGAIALMEVESGLWGETNPSVADHIKPNRDYYNAVSASAQTSPTSPFNGTTGMGFGTLANRPTTCSVGLTDPLDAGKGGVGYFATDVGSQGTLYRCASTNNWVVHYTPYQYPHPLVSGSVVPPPPPPPTTYTITSSAGTGGTITPGGTITLNSGSSQTFTFTPNTGYRVSNVIVNGNSYGSVSSYTFNNVTSNQSISVSFSLVTPIVGDFNSDGLVNSIDLSLLTSRWNTNYPAYDLSPDGIINSLDYAILSNNWSL